MTRVRATIGLLVAFMAAACSQAGAEQQVALEELQAAAAGDPTARVEVVALKSSRSALTLQLPGEVQGWHDALLSSPTGGLIEEVRVSAGDEVKSGATLVAVDRDPAYARLKQTKAALAMVKDELARAQRLGDLAVEAQLSSLRSRVVMAEADVSMARSNLARTVITAPFSGTIGMVGVEKGEVTQPGVPAVRLVQLDPVKVVLSVADRDVVALEKGLPARVETPASGQILAGTISHVGPVADLSTRSFLVEVEVPNEDRSLLPGMIARVSVDKQITEGALLLPQQWLVTKLDGYGVFVIEDDVARWRDIKLGAVVRSQVVVREGLAEGDRIVVVGQHGLVDGDAVLIGREGVCCEDGRPSFGP